MANNSMWDQTEQMAKQHDQGGGAWLKLPNDGDTAVMVFLGEPFPREACFADGRYQLFNEDLRGRGFKASLRVGFNVALYESREVKVLEQGVVFFKDLIEVRNKYGLEKWAFEIKRHGTGKETRYSILPEHQLSPDQYAAFDALPQHDMEQLYGDDGSSGGGTQLGSYDKPAEGPIDTATSQALVGRLKALPREAVDSFCAELGVKRIKDLPAAKLSEAKALVDKLEAEMRAAHQAPAEVDPFA